MMMMRRGGGETRSGTNAFDTINAAASAIANAESRVPQATTVQKRRWAKGWGVYWCFGFQRHRKRIGHTAVLPESVSNGRNDPRAENLTFAPSIVLPFTAPPSSPASFLQSEPPSELQSPAGFKSSISANMYSPGPSSIFAIGPYAHETQLVSPPVFSSFTTEPSTAPFTPPAESVHLTTPSSPEVPFAQTLDSNFRFGDGYQRYPLSQYEFQSYQLYPGSPIGQLISPSSGISNSGEAHKVLNLDILFTRDWGSRLCSGSVTPDAAKSTSSEGFTLKPHTPEVVFNAPSKSRRRSDGASLGHRVSFELSAEEVIRCVEKPVALAEAVSASLSSEEKTERDSPDQEVSSSHERPVLDGSNDSLEKVVGGDAEEACHLYQKERSITLGSAKEFNFDNADGGDSGTSSIRTDWWANEKVVSEDKGESKNWSFFPITQPGMS